MGTGVEFKGSVGDFNHKKQALAKEADAKANSSEQRGYGNSAGSIC